MTYTELKFLVQDRGNHNTFVTGKYDQSDSFMELVFRCKELLPANGVKLYIDAANWGNDTSDRQRTIDERIMKMKRVDYIILDALQQLVMDVNDAQECEAFYGLCQYWAWHTGAAITVIDRSL